MIQEALAAHFGTGTRKVHPIPSALASPPFLMPGTANAINKKCQLDLSNATTDPFPIGPDKKLVATLGLFVPNIGWDNGIFYIICTNASHKNGGDLCTDNYIITSPDILADEWSDPIWFDYDGIDPSLLFDDKMGKVYVQASWREGSKVWTHYPPGSCAVHLYLVWICNILITVSGFQWTALH